MNKTKILIVEDEAIIAENIKETIKELGYDVVGIAANALDAIDLFHTTKPDIILLDINIQGEKNGIWLAKNIFSTKPFVFLTAYGDENTIKEAVSTKPSGYLLKPFRVEDISATIQLALENFVNNKEAILNDKPVKKAEEKNFISTKKTVFIKQKSAYIKLVFEDILFIEADKNYLKIQTLKEQFKIRSTLKDITNNLPKTFIQTHRSFIVNSSYIEKINPLNLVVETFTIPLGSSFKKNVLNILNLIS